MSMCPRIMNQRGTIATRLPKVYFIAITMEPSDQNAIKEFKVNTEEEVANWLLQRNVLENFCKILKVKQCYCGVYGTLHS